MNRKILLEYQQLKKRYQNELKEDQSKYKLLPLIKNNK